MAELRFSHLGICVSDLEASLAFYQALGFERVSELEVKGEPSETLLGLRDVELHAVYLRRDAVTIELLDYPSPGVEGDGRPRAMNALGLTHLSFRVEGIDAVAESLVSAGGRMLPETRVEHPALGARALFLTDPDGTRIELVETRRTEGLPE